MPDPGPNHVCFYQPHPETLAGLPLMNKKVYQREQAVAAMRDATYSSEPQIDKGQAKDAARDSRLKRSA